MPLHLAASRPVFAATKRRAAINSDFVQIVRFSNTLTVTWTDITKNIEFFGFPQLALSAKYRLFLTYIAKRTQMSFSRCTVVHFFAGRHCDYWHLYVLHNRVGQPRGAREGVAPQDRVIASCQHILAQPVKFYTYPVFFVGTYHVRILRILFWANLRIFGWCINYGSSGNES